MQDKLMLLEHKLKELDALTADLGMTTPAISLRSSIKDFVIRIQPSITLCKLTEQRMKLSQECAA